MEDNVVEFTGEWQGEENPSAMEEMLSQLDIDTLGRTVSGVLEFLAVRAYVDGPYYIVNEDSTAATVIATNDDVATLIAALPDNFKSWDEMVEEVPEFIQHSDPGDEQDEPTA